MQYIVDVMRQLGWAVQLDKFTSDTPLGPKDFTNIGQCPNAT